MTCSPLKAAQGKYRTEPLNTFHLFMHCLNVGGLRMEAMVFVWLVAILPSTNSTFSTLYFYTLLTSVRGSNLLDRSFSNGVSLSLGHG